MADPTIQTFCCHHAGYNEDMAVKIMNEFNTDSYNILCLTSSVVGMIGAMYQIMMPARQHQHDRGATVSPSRGRRIIIWLAVADLLASLGVCLRSSLWLRYKNIMPVQNDSVSVLFCAITSAWTQYFYTATWLWTLFYAIDTYLVLTERRSHHLLYHSIAWGLPAAFTSVGLTILYYPDANCHNLTSLRSALVRIMPNYLATYLPIAVVMIANPIIYVIASKHAERAVSMSLSRFTSKERKLVDTLKLKFFLINTVFYLCWLPNLVNGVIIWILWFHMPIKVIISIWYIMALLNPLQAMFNALVYRRWVGGMNLVSTPVLPRIFWKSQTRRDDVGERAPLLNSEPSGYRVNSIPLKTRETYETL